MAIISPLASLVAILNQVGQIAQQNQQLLTKNEAATRAALIDPVLRALGWDTANVRMVEPEKTINTTWRADYALHDATGKIDLLLEAKAMGSNLDRYSVVQQLLSYAFGFGVLKVILTDGLNWHFYNDFKPGAAVADSHFDLLQEEPASCALQLVKWLDITHFGFGLPASLVSVSQPVTPTLSAQIIVSTKDQKSRKESDERFTDLVQISTLALAPGQKPKQLRLPDGSIAAITSWKDVLVETCRFLLRHHEALNLPLPDKAGKKRFLLSATKAEVGSSTSATYKQNPVFIYTHYSATDCIANALYAVSQLPASSRKFQLAIDF